jgi:hypothetical protein
MILFHRIYHIIRISQQANVYYQSLKLTDHSIQTLMIPIDIHIDMINWDDVLSVQYRILSSSSVSRDY